MALPFAPPLAPMLSRAGHDPLDDGTLDRTTRIEYLLGFIIGRFRHRRALVGDDVDQPFMAQALEHFPDDRTADTEGGGERIFRQGGARRNAMVDDGCPDLPVDRDIRAAGAPPVRRIGRGCSAIFGRSLGHARIEAASRVRRQGSSAVLGPAMLQ